MRKNEPYSQIQWGRNVQDSWYIFFILETNVNIRSLHFDSSQWRAVGKIFGEAMRTSSILLLKLWLAIGHFKKLPIMQNIITHDRGWKPKKSH